MIDPNTLIESLEVHLKNLKNDFDRQYNAIQESKNSDTKSSMGDKFETSREMAQSELDKLQISIHHIQMQLATLQQINTKKQNKTIELGSLVSTESEIFFIAIPLGKWTFQGKTIYIISPHSPIGQQLIGKKAGESFFFQNKTNKIIQIQ